MDEWFWTIGLGPALARLQGTGPSGSAPPVVADEIPTKIGFRTVAGLRIRSAECGGGAPQSILMTSPWPESMYAFSPVWDALARHFHVTVGAAMDTIEGYDLPPEIRDDYLESYAGDRFVESMRYARRYPDELPELAELLPAIDTPVLIVAGRRDRVVPLANAEFLDARLPSSRLVILDAGHFVWEEAAGEYESIVLDWATDGYRDAAR